MHREYLAVWSIAQPQITFVDGIEMIFDRQ
jgi:hypothetical protein